MRAAVYRRFGGPDVVHIEDVPTPAPRAGEVRIRIAATTASMADYRMRTRDLPEGLGFLAPIMLGVFQPRHKILGMDLSGTIDAVGENVTKWRVGDEVIAMPGGAFGAHAEYICIPEDGAIALKPKNMSLDEAVTLVFGGSTIAAFLEQAPLKPGAAVLVNGASSSTGTAAIQLAKYYGATVTAVCSAANADLVTSLGAERVIDYTSEDLETSGDTYDAIFDCIGNATFERIDALLKPGGVFVPVAATLHTMLTAGRKAKRAGKRSLPSSVRPTAATLATIAAAAEAGAFRPVVDRTYVLEDIVEAHRYLDTFRKRGNLLVKVAAPVDA